MKRMYIVGTISTGDDLLPIIIIFRTTHVATEMTLNVIEEEDTLLSR